MTITTTPPTQNPVALATAHSIASSFAREAIWAENGRCTWQGASLEKSNGNWSILTRSFGPDLYSGIAGVALFLANAKAKINDHILKITLNGAVKTLLFQLENGLPQLNWSLHSGKLGVGYALWRIGRLTGNDKWSKRGIELVLSLENQLIEAHELDIISGVAGSIPVLLRLFKEEQNETFKSMALSCGEFLIKSAKKESCWWSWESISGSQALTGYSHGASGFGLALLELWAVTRDQKFQEAAMMAFAYERAHFLPKEGNWPDLRGEETASSSRPPTCGEAWCHGAPGIALARLRAYQLFPDPVFWQEAVIALETTSRSVRSSLQNPGSMNFSLCHGAAGNASILLSGALATGNPTYAELAHQVGVSGIHLYDLTGTAWPSGINDPSGATEGRNPTPGFMLGKAGTGYFYLKLAFPNEIEDILLIH